MLVYGTETEFGIDIRSPDTADPVSESLYLINHYPLTLSTSVLWDYETENPLLDCRGFEVEGERERPSPDYNRLLNKLLPNGGRLYVDGAHPEYSTPECTSPLEIVVYEKAGEQILAECLRAIERAGRGRRVVLYKNNTDGKGNSYGYHENYLVARAVPFERLAEGLIPFFVTRQIFAGAGKVGAENQTAPAPFQISQRADFVETQINLNTMVKRPLINTRDEPHADPARYRRVHVIVGDANMSEMATYLKVGTTGLVLDMLQAGFDIPFRALDDPIAAIKTVSRDLTVNVPLRLADRRMTSSLDVQRIYLKAAQDFCVERGTVGEHNDLLHHWERVLDQLERDPVSLSGELDWVAKSTLMQSFMARKGCGWDDLRVRMMDFQYHDLRPGKGLYFTLAKRNRMRSLVSETDVSRAEISAPRGTRAYFRSACLRKFPKDVYAASWSSLLFDLGCGTLTKLPLLDPLRGTESLTREILETSDTVSQLLEKLRA